MEVCVEDSQKLGCTTNWGEGDREDFERECEKTDISDCPIG